MLNFISFIESYVLQYIKNIHLLLKIGEPLSLQPKQQHPKMKEVVHVSI